MKNVNLVILLMFFLNIANAQDVVNWKHSAKKIADKTYELHLTATISESWHIYSQHITEGGPVPTSILFAKNPIITLNKDVKEIGDVIKKREEVFDMDVQYFKGKVDFVQNIELKANVKTNINGTIKYMVCNDSECLPPKTIIFSVAIN
jgi:hypothetical protein